MSISHIVQFRSFADPKDRAWTGASRDRERALASVKDICEVFHNLSHWHGKTIAIRGRYRYAREVAGLYGTECPELRSAIYTEWALTAAEQAQVGAVVDNTRQDGTAIDAILSGEFRMQTGLTGFGHLGVFPAKLRVTKVLRFESVADIMHPAYMGR